MHKTLLSASVIMAIAVAAPAQLSEGDQHWNARAEGHQGGRAKAAQIDAAIAAAMLMSIVLFALGRPGWGGAVWAVGFAVKPHPVVILPVLAVLAYRRSGWRGPLRAAGGAALVLALVLGPWVLHGDGTRVYNTYKILFQSDLYSGRLSSAAWNLWWFWDVHSHPLPHDAMFVGLVTAEH